MVNKKEVILSKLNKTRKPQDEQVNRQNHYDSKTSHKLRN